MAALTPETVAHSRLYGIVQIPFDRVLTPHALSIPPQEGKLTLVGFRSQWIPMGHTGSPAVLVESVPQAQPSFGRI